MQRRNRMTVGMEQTKQTIISHCHLLLKRQWYALTADRLVLNWIIEE